MAKEQHMSIRRYIGSWWLPVVAAAILGASTAEASIIISATSVSGFLHPFGLQFEVDLNNTGPTAQNIASFSVGISVADPNFTFPAGGPYYGNWPYIFYSDSFDLQAIQINPAIVPSPAGQSIEFTDRSNSGLGVSIDAGSTVTLGVIYVTVAPTATAGSFTTTIAPDCPAANSCTSLWDSAGNSVPFSLTNGTITLVEPVFGPEPSTVLLVLLAVPAMAVWKRTRRDRSA
jgi:hypothetical protein